MYGFLSISVGIDFDDNGKNKEKKHIMRHLKKTQCFVSNHATLVSNLLSFVISGVYRLHYFHAKIEELQHQKVLYF